MDDAFHVLRPVRALLAVACFVQDELHRETEFRHIGLLDPTIDNTYQLSSLIDNGSGQQRTSRETAEPGFNSHLKPAAVQESFSKRQPNADQELLNCPCISPTETCGTKW